MILKLDGKGKILPLGFLLSGCLYSFRVPAQKILSVLPGTLMPTHFKLPTVYLGEAKWKFYIPQCIPLTPLYFDYSVPVLSLPSNKFKDVFGRMMRPD